MGFTPAGSIGMALAVGLAAATAGSYVYLRPGSHEGRSDAADVRESPPTSVQNANPAGGTSEEASRPEAPRFDLVRVAPDGSGLAAGWAEPGARVRIRSGDDTLAEVEAGPSGDFAAIFRAEPEETPQMLGLEAEAASGDRVKSEEHVLLLPPPSAPSASGQDRQVDWSAAGGGPLVGDHQEATSESETVAATAVLPPDAPVEVAAALDPGVAARELSLASIDYGEDGSVRLAGSAPPDSRLRIYVDEALAGDRIADAGGRWDASLEGIEEGVYRIRVDALGADGDVTGRVETPFQRTFPSTAGNSGTVTVQPGNNLWTIARTRYGSGMHYTQIFTENADLIENPDLIYPGQIFVLPQLEREAGGAAARE